MATKVSLFIVNYDRELRMRADIRRKGKVENVMEFSERMKKVQEEAEAALREVQEEIKQQAERRRKETEEWKKENRLLLSTKNLVFKERLAKKLVDHYRPISHWQDSFYQYGQITTAYFDKNSSSSEYQLDSTI